MIFFFSISAPSMVELKLHHLLPFILGIIPVAATCVLLTIMPFSNNNTVPVQERPNTETGTNAWTGTTKRGAATRLLPGERQNNKLVCRRSVTILMPVGRLNLLVKVSVLYHLCVCVCV